MKTNCSIITVLLGVLLLLVPEIFGQVKPARPDLPNLDKRKAQANTALSKEKTAAAASLRTLIPSAKVDFDEIIGSPKMVSVPGGFLSEPNGKGKAISPDTAAVFPADDPYRVTKAFLKAHSALFGHGPEVLVTARIKREFVTAHNGLKTVVWEQQLDGIPVFEGLLTAHTTKNEELVSLASHFLPDPAKAALEFKLQLARQLSAPQTKGAEPAVADKLKLELQPAITAQQAVASASQNLGDKVAATEVTAVERQADGAEKRQHFKAAGIKGEADTHLVWLPMNHALLRLCWEVILTSQSRGEMFRILVDAQNGAVLVRHCLTSYISEATYRVYLSDSPSPFSPGHPTPLTNQPPLGSRVLVVTDALSTLASPNGWINDGVNETRGNNVDAHLDRNADDLPDLPRPHGSPFRVFDFPLDLTSNPSSYGNAAVVQLFYWCNWMHDKLYELGFTEAAGNFQVNNFGRGGLGNDALQADAQDGFFTDNANFSTPPDGTSPRMQMFLWTGPNPSRDGSLDAEIILHEHTHGLSNRRVGGGVGISALVTRGMGEGWSDFYGLALLSETGDNLNGNYATGGYVTYRLFGLTENYYYGIRRYPYSTDLSKNPLTFKDIDPAQAIAHDGIPLSPISGGFNPAFASEVHNVGELWCVALWEARASLINKHGFAVGNQLILKLVTDGMNLAPANPNFPEARDAIILADQVNTGGANADELWAAFAKRGMGFSATAPNSETTSGLEEAYDVPDDLRITPTKGLTASGPAGGLFNPALQSYSLTNVSTNLVIWTATKSASWFTLSSASGSLPVGASAATVDISLNAAANYFPTGIYSDTITFSNHVTGRTQSRPVVLRVGQPDHFTESFTADDFDLASETLTFTPDGSASFYSVCRQGASSFPVDPRDSKEVFLGDDSFWQINLGGGEQVWFYGKSNSVFYIGSNGYVTFGEGDSSVSPTLLAHFQRARIAALFNDLDPSSAGRISWNQLGDRAVVTFQNVPEYLENNSNNFQIEMFYDGRIRITYLSVAARNGLVGLSRGSGVPSGFAESDFSAYGACSPSLTLSIPKNATEGNGTLTAEGKVTLPAPSAVAVVVALSSSDTTEVTVPDTVTIPAGETTASFDLTIVDDTATDGTQIATLTAAAPQYNSASANVFVHDNETATLRVVLPPSASEDAGTVQGTVTVSTPVTSSVVVNLISLNPSALQVPPFVVIPAGETSVPFTATLTDDTRIDGTEIAGVTAHVENWGDGSGAIDLLDNENTVLVLTAFHQASEGAGTLVEAGSVTISGTLPTNLVVSLSSSDTSKVRVPASATIEAGKTVGTFDLTLVDNGIIDGDHLVTIIAEAPTWASGTDTINVLDDEIPPVPSNPAPPHLATNVAANVDLSWRLGDSQGELIVNGGFETGDLTGWFAQNNGNGNFVINFDGFDPDSPDGPLPPFDGRYNAVTDPTGPGHREIYQDIAIPTDAAKAVLRWADRIRNHAGVFADDQKFAVEIRDPSNTVLVVAFTTKPGDTLLSDWVERSYDLVRFRGQTVRVVFVEEDGLFYFNAHVDNVSVEVSAAAPTTYDVYFGTNPTPGPPQLLGNTTNTFWDLPALTPMTTYYWQIVAKRLGQTIGPVWQFSTRGVDHFEWTTIGSPQHATVPFTASITAKDDLNNVVSNFTGAVKISGLTGSDKVFGDDFEDGNFGDWTTEGGSYTRSVTTATAAGGTHSFTMIGGSQSFFDGISHELEKLRPRRINFSVRARDKFLAGGYFVVGTGIDNASTAVFFYLNNDGTMGIYEDSGGAHNVSYVANRWYRISLLFDWITKHVDFFVDDELVEASIPFRGSNVNELTKLSLFNYDNTQNWWDEIEFHSGIPREPLSVTPASSGEFVNGAWTGNLSMPDLASNAVLRAEDAQGNSGLSNPFKVGPAPGMLDHFEWSVIPSPQYIDMPFTATITAKDPFNATVPGFSGTVHLSGFAAGLGSFVGNGAGTSIYPLATFFHDARSQVIYLASETGPARRLAGLALNVATVPGQTLNNWTIRMKHTTLSSYGTRSWQATGWTTVFQRSVTIVSNGWANFFFTAPFDYDGTNNLMIDFSFNNSAYSFDGECRVTATPTIRSINFRSDSNDGDPLTWTGTSPAAFGNNFIPNLRLQTFQPPVAIVPQDSEAFVNGSWTGSVAIHDPAAINYLLADDLNDHTGVANSFVVGLADDLSLMISDSPDPVLASENVTYVLGVTNSGPGEATGVIITNLLPGNATFISATSSSGNITIADGRVTCDLGALPGTVGASLTIVVSPMAAGTITNQATVTRNEPDLELANNSASAVTTVVLPSLTIDEVTVTEGNSGTMDALFTVRLSIASRQVITVNFATANGTAVAGQDFVSTNGVLTFNPGNLAKTIAVPIIGETRYEANETFRMLLSAPVNATLATTQATATINNDDPIPLLSINDVTVTEGNSGVTNAIFTIHLSAPSSQSVTVHYATANGTAVAPGDYVTAGGNLTFTAGQTNKTVTIRVNGDATNELDETFIVALSDAVNANLGKGRGFGTIVNDDPINIVPAGLSLLAENCSPTNGLVDPGETVTMSFALKNAGFGDQTVNLTATLLASGGVTSPSAPQSYGVLAVGGSAVSNSFTFSASGVCGGTVTATLQLRDGASDLGTVSNVFRMGGSGIIYSENFDSVAPPNLPSGWTAALTGVGAAWITSTNNPDGAPNAVFAPDPASTSDNVLTSPGIPIVTAGAQVTFRHSYATEASFDGGRLEISIAGGPFMELTAAGGSFVDGGYNGAISGSPAWTGNSSGFITTIASLPPAVAGQNVQFRWHLTSDPSAGGIGWYVDSVSLTDLTCCAPPVAPALLAPVRIGSIFSCTCATVANRIYVLEYKNSLSDSNWQPVQTKPGDGTMQLFTDSEASNSHRYYRIRAE